MIALQRSGAFFLVASRKGRILVQDPGHSHGGYTLQLGNIANTGHRLAFITGFDYSGVGNPSRISGKFALSVRNCIMAIVKYVHWWNFCYVHTFTMELIFYAGIDFKRKY